MDYAELKRRIESGDRESYTISDPADNGICPVCNGTTWEIVDQEVRNGEHVEIIKAARRCTYCNGGHVQTVTEKKIRADIPVERSLSDFSWSVYGVDLTREKKIVDSFVSRLSEFEREGLGLFISSKIRGSGKTFLASAIGGELVEKYEASIKFVSASDLLEISKQKQDDGRDPLDDLISCRVLILDDLGQKLTGRDWLTDVLFRIIDKRYTAKRIMIVTSNVALPELNFDDRIVDRLNAMTVQVRLPEFCVRAREANSRKKQILQRLGIE